MLVEDNPDHREVYGGVLWYNGFNVLLVPDGASALKATSFVRPDLILLDLGLPDVWGLDICGPLSTPANGHAIPVVALSSFSRLEMEGPALSAGCRHYLEKATPLEVLHLVERLLGQAPPAGEGSTPWMIPFPPQSAP